MTVEFLSDGPPDAPQTLVLAHGAGAPMDTPFMQFFARELGARGVRVLRFEFPYMAGRRTTGKRRAPDRAEVLLASWREAVATTGASRPFIGGKSMGGRMASMLAADSPALVGGLVCLGYPFHPPGAPEKTRTAHLAELQTPALIVQGTKDSFGAREDVAGYTLSPHIRIHWIEGANHDLRAPGRKPTDSWQEAAEAIERFLTNPASASAGKP